LPNKDTFIFYNTNNYFRNIRPKLYFALLHTYFDGDGYSSHRFISIYDSLSLIKSKIYGKTYRICLNIDKLELEYNYIHKSPDYIIKVIFMNKD